ncbi:MAG: DUF1059 domain-containing protein [Patescibacteria group bacterium]
MKTLTCKQLGGTCDVAMTAATEEEMKTMAWKHVAEAHPEKFAATQDVMKDATREQQDQSAAYFHKNWEAAPEDAA